MRRIPKQRVAEAPAVLSAQSLRRFSWPPGASLADFIFTMIVVFQGWASPPSEDEIHGDDRMRQLREIGPKEAWAGTLRSANLGNRPDAEAPTFELLQLDDAVRSVRTLTTTLTTNCKR